MRSVRTVAKRVLMLHQGTIYTNSSVTDLFASTDPLIHHFVNGISTPRDILF